MHLKLLKNILQGQFVGYINLNLIKWLNKLTNSMILNIMISLDPYWYYLVKVNFYNNMATIKILSKLLNF
jgi:hypothetical protein